MKRIEGVVLLEHPNEAIKENVPRGTVFVIKNSNEAHPMWNVEKSLTGSIAEVFLFDDAILIAKLFSDEALVRTLKMREENRQWTAEEILAREGWGPPPDPEVGKSWTCCDGRLERDDRCSICGEDYDEPGEGP